MNTVLYARVSTKDKGQDATNQLLQLREFCAKQNWTIVHEYTDKVSGKHSDREQFQKMFAAASRREFDLVLFWSLDRFSREGTVETLQHLHCLTDSPRSWRLGIHRLLTAPIPLQFRHSSDLLPASGESF